MRRIRPYLWIRLGKKRLGIVPDTDLRLFSERYGYVKVWRCLGYKFILREHSNSPSDPTPLFFGGWV